MHLSISFTTRAPRSGEKDGVHYHFISEQRFKEMIQAGDFFEYAKVHGDWKGTARQSVLPLLDADKDVLLEIDWQGAQQVRSKINNTVSIFVLPPSLEILQQRLCQRAQDSASVINQRMRAASQEISHYTEYDYIIINRSFDDALAQLCAIFQASRLRCCAQQQRLQHVIETLTTP